MLAESQIHMTVEQAVQCYQLAMKICPKTMNCCSVLSINMICIRQIYSPTETSIHTRSVRVLMNSLSSVRLTIDTKNVRIFLSASRKRGSLDTIVTDFKFAHSSFTASSLIYLLSFLEIIVFDIVLQLLSIQANQQSWKSLFVIYTIMERWGSSENDMHNMFHLNQLCLTLDATIPQ